VRLLSGCHIADQEQSAASGLATAKIYGQSGHKPVGWAGIVAPAMTGATPRVGRRAHEKREPAGWQTPLANVRKLCGLRLLRGFGLRFRNDFHCSHPPSQNLRPRLPHDSTSCRHPKLPLLLSEPTNTSRIFSPRRSMSGAVGKAQVFSPG
jgi:hypothetical protein